MVFIISTDVPSRPAVVLKSGASLEAGGREVKIPLGGSSSRRSAPRKGRADPEARSDSPAWRTY